MPPERRFVGFDAYQQVLDAGRGPGAAGHAAAFPPDALRRGGQGRQARLHGEALLRRRPRLPHARGRQRRGPAARSSRVVVGLQRRHQRNYLEGIQKIRDGAIGDVRLIRTYFNMPGGGRAGRLKPAGMSEMEYQIRHWGMFCWLCGDHLVEQATPRDRRGQLGHRTTIRSRPTAWAAARSASGPGNGDIWDHHCHRVRVRRRRAATSARPGSRPAPGATSPTTSTAPRARSRLGTGAWGFGDADAARAPRRRASRRQSLSARARRPDGQHPRQRPVSLRGRLRRHQQHDRRDGPHGDLLRASDHLGRGGQVRTAPRPEALRLGRRPAGRRPTPTAATTRPCPA